ncbi:MAG: 16S rRNA (cytidine(1402)-2'-O)-methyltransferase [bacterium]|nr:16S rRNA (cytidine(1402)-2'-O)-methyltransferase [bacterium]
MSTLFVVATPIGNLKDITLRAIETLKEVDLILAEDTRVTKKLLFHYDIRVPLKSYHEHSDQKMLDFVAQTMRQGKNVAMVTDAGTPAISDPGARLVAYMRNALPEVKITPIPGPSALISALSVAGISADSFTFLGYPPHKKGRQTFFKNLEKIEVRPIVLYESPHRLEKTFEALAEVFGENRDVIVAKELTKLHEEIWRGTIEEAKKYFTGLKSKGEFTLILL